MGAYLPCSMCEGGHLSQRDTRVAVAIQMWSGLRAVWGALLYIWSQLAWAVLVAAGLIQMVQAALEATGLLTPTDRVDGDGWGVTVLVIAILNGAVDWYSHHIAMMPRTRQTTEEQNPYLYGLVTEQAQLAGLLVPKVVESEIFTASVIGRSARHAVLGVSPTLQYRLNRRELGAVIAHEMAHVRNRDALIMSVAVTAVGLVLGILLLIGFHGWVGAIVLLPSVMSWLRESRADTTAAYVYGDSLALASALSKLPRSSFRSFLLSPYTHPPTELRVWCLKRLAKRSG